MTALSRPRVSTHIGLLVVGMVAIHLAAHGLLLHGGLPVETALLVIATDLTITTAALAWFTLVRTGIARWTTLIPVVAAGLIAARLLLPVDIPGHLDWMVGGMLGAAELLVAGVALGRLGRIRRAWAHHRSTGHDAHSALEGALSTALPRGLAAAVATEGMLLALAVVGPFRRAPATTPHTFPGLWSSQWPGLVGVLAFVGLAEGACLHLVLGDAWPVLNALHLLVVVYGLLWLMGDFHALRLLPVRLDRTHLHVQVGLRWRARVPRALIQDARVVTDVPEGSDALDLTLPGATHVEVCLSRPVAVSGLLGIRRTSARLVVSVDEPAALVAQLTP